MRGGIGIWGKKLSLAMGCLLLALGMLAPQAAQAVVRCVGGGWTSGACGSTYTDLQIALKASAPGDEIWVEHGRYTPTTGTDRTATFQLKNGVALYGGFVGDETDRSERRWTHNVTLLSGDIGTLGDNADNSYHVVTGSGTFENAILDGFNIREGNADGASPHDCGGGMVNVFGFPTVSHVTFSGSSAAQGGGMYNQTSSPKLANVTFTGNSASNGGGGMYNCYNSSPKLANVTFTGNSASNGGGGMYNYYNSSPTLANVVFLNNDGHNGGGGMLNQSSSNPELSNVTFTGNSAYDYGGIFNHNSSPTIFNCIFWGDARTEIFDYNSSSIVSYSLVQGGYDGGDHIIDDDPLFINAANGNLTLEAGSPAIDAGSYALVAQDFCDLDGDGYTNEKVPFDRANMWRVDGSSVDMGAYEYQGGSVYPNAILCVGGGAEWKGNSTCKAIYTGLQAALLRAGTDSEIWVAKGTYKPTIGTNRSVTFRLKNRVALFGGFTGSEKARSGRDWKANETILSGDIGTQGDKTDNSYHVVTGSGTDKSAILNGFVITGGNANAAVPDDCGGGMYNSGGNPTLSNATFSGNFAAYGGGMYNSGGNPTLSNATFSGNFADYGGGMHNDSGSPMLSSVTFSGNHAISDGGGMYNSGNPTLSNAIFSGNRASKGEGGGIYNSGSPTLSNATFNGNSAYHSSGGMYNYFGYPTVSNCIFCGDGNFEIINAGNSLLNVTFSLVQGGYAGVGNINKDPLFINASNGDLRLQAGSPAIDAGSNALVARDFADLDGDGNTNEPVPYDLAGGPRFVNGTVDMGAYEYQGAATSVELAYFRAIRFHADILVKWKTASETDNAGFHVWRSGKKNGKYARITESPIPTEGSPFEGAAYSFQDTDVEPKRAYFYKLEDIDIHGASTFHGPVGVGNSR